MNDIECAEKQLVLDKSYGPHDTGFSGSKNGCYLRADTRGFERWRVKLERFSDNIEAHGYGKTCHRAYLQARKNLVAKAEERARKAAEIAADIKNQFTWSGA